MKVLKKHPIIAGTLLLTTAGLASRFIGFFYRIFLAKTFGEENMGIYQLISPVMAIAFALSCAGFQSTISKFVAAQTASPYIHKSYKPLKMGIYISLPLSLLCMFFLLRFNVQISTLWLKEPRVAPMLSVVALTIPICCVHACINGYFYGIKQSSVPAFTQLFEQICRVGFVYFYSLFALKSQRELTIHVAIWGLAIGELLSLLATLSALFLYRYRENRNGLLSSQCNLSYHRFFGMVLPLMGNRLILNLLGSAESLYLPIALRSFGYDRPTSLSVYGVLTGMAIPLIYFPNALTGSLSVLLLPHISEQHANGNMAQVQKDIMKSLQFCVLMGMICCIFFFFTGKWIGTSFFSSELAGRYIVILSFICPFLYLDVTLSGILQGLGMAGKLFLVNVIALLLRLLFVYISVPKMGITGYLIGLLVSQIVLCFLYLVFLMREISFTLSRNK